MAGVFFESCGAVFSGKSPANHIWNSITVSQWLLLWFTQCYTKFQNKNHIFEHSEYSVTPNFIKINKFLLQNQMNLKLNTAFLHYSLSFIALVSIVKITDRQLRPFIDFERFSTFRCF